MKFNWLNAIERGLWTGVQVPSVMGILDGMQETVSVPGWSYLIGGGLGVLISVVKTLAHERLLYLKALKEEQDENDGH